MRVLHITDTFSGNGVERAILNSFDEAHCVGTEYSFLALNPDHLDWGGVSDNVGIHSCMSPDFETIKCAVSPRHRQRKELLSSVLASRPDIIHAHLEYSHIIARSVSSSLGIPYLVSHHMGKMPRFQGNLAVTLLSQYLHKRSYLKASHIIAVSDFIATLIRSCYSIHDRLSVIENSISDYYWCVNTDDPANKLYDIAFCGRLVYDKGPHILLDVLERAAEAGRRHRAVVIGDGPLFNSLRNRAQGGLLSGSVDFTGKISHMEVAETLKRSRIFYAPSAFEAMGLAAYEAAALGLGLVLNNIPTFNDLASCTEGVLVTERNDISGTLNAIELLLGSASRYDRSPLRDRFSVTRHTRELNKVYSNVISHT